MNLYGDINIQVAYANFIKDPSRMEHGKLRHSELSCGGIFNCRNTVKSQSEIKFMCCMISYLKSLSLLGYQGDMSPKYHHLFCSAESKF